MAVGTWRQDDAPAPAAHDDLRGGDAGYNAAVTRRLLDGERGPVRDIVVLNAATALVAGDLVNP